MRSTDYSVFGRIVKKRPSTRFQDQLKAGYRLLAVFFCLSKIPFNSIAVLVCVLYQISMSSFIQPKKLDGGNLMKKFFEKIFQRCIVGIPLMCIMDIKKGGARCEGTVDNV